MSSNPRSARRSNRNSGGLEANQNKKIAPDIAGPVIFGIICSFIVFGGSIFFFDNYFLFKIEQENYKIRQEIHVLREQIVYLQHQLKGSYPIPVASPDATPVAPPTEPVVTP